MKTSDSSSNIVRELEMDDLREVNVHQSWRDRLQSKVFIGYSNQSGFKSILIAILCCFFFVVFTLCEYENFSNDIFEHKFDRLIWNSLID